MTTVMIVDDSADLRHLLAQALTSAGHRAIEAAGGAEALSLVESVRPDLILLDISMPDMDGFAVLAKLRSMSDAVARTPVWMMTAHGDPASVRNALRHAALEYFVKGSYDIDDLLERVAQLQARSEGPKSVIQ